MPASPLLRSSPVPDGCAPLVRILLAVSGPLDGSMTTAALLTALRGVTRLGGYFNDRSCPVAFAARLIVPALPALPRQTPACALAALRACARSGGALPCREPPPAPLKCRCGGGSVIVWVQVADRDDAISQRARRTQAAASSLCCDDAPAGTVGAHAGTVGVPAGAPGAPECAEIVPAGAVAASAGAVGSLTGATAAPLGAVCAPVGAEDVSGRVVRGRVVVGDVVLSGVGGWQVVASGSNRGSLVGVRSVRVVGAGESAAARVAGRELPLSDAAGRVCGGLSLNGWRRTCVCGIWLGVAQWDMQAGVCACGRRLLYKWARDGPYKSLDVPLVPRVLRPMPDWYGWTQVFYSFTLFGIANTAATTSCRPTCCASLWSAGLCWGRSPAVGWLGPFRVVLFLFSLCPSPMRQPGSNF